MSIFGNHDPDQVRDNLMENGVNCGHVGADGKDDCTVIIQSTRDGTLNDGVNAHWNTVHPESR